MKKTVTVTIREHYKLVKMVENGERNKRNGNHNGNATHRRFMKEELAVYTHIQSSKKTCPSEYR